VTVTIEHLEILNGGVAAWNEWMRANPGIKPDLKGRDLGDRDLSDLNLSEAELSGAEICPANLSDFNLKLFEETR
jgi:hypothetical protein